MPRPVAAAAPSPGNPCATQPGSFKLAVDRPGIYAVTQAELQAAGWNGAPDIARLHLYQGACVAANEVALDRAANSFTLLRRALDEPLQCGVGLLAAQESSAGLSMATRGGRACRCAAPIHGESSPPTACSAAPPRLQHGVPRRRRRPLFPGRRARRCDSANHLHTRNPAPGPAELRLNLQGMTLDSTISISRSMGIVLPEQTWSGMTTFTAKIPLGVEPACGRGARARARASPAARSTPCCWIAAALTLPGAACRRAGADALRRRRGGAALQRRRVRRALGTALRRARSAPPGAADRRERRRECRVAGCARQPARYALVAPNGTLRPTIVADTAVEPGAGRRRLSDSRLRPIPACHRAARGIIIAARDCASRRWIFRMPTTSSTAVSCTPRRYAASCATPTRAGHAPHRPIRCWWATAPTTFATGSAWDGPASCRPTSPTSIRGWSRPPARRATGAFRPTTRARAAAGSARRSPAGR